MKVDVAASRADALKALAEPWRWRIIELLAGEDLCVCHLVDALGLPQPLVSHHLKVLRLAGLVEAERFKQWTYYRLSGRSLAGIAAQIDTLVTSSVKAGSRRRPCC